MGGRIEPESVAAFGRNIQVEHSDEVERINSFDCFEYIIVLTKILGASESKEFKILTISHECRHLIQELRIKDNHSKYIVLKRYFDLILNRYFKSESECYLKELSNKIYRNMPTDYDANLFSKRMAFKICREEKVNEFLDEKIKECRIKLLHTRFDSPGIVDEAISLTYWEYIKAINIKVSFDYAREFEEIWNTYDCPIKKEIEIISSKGEEQRDKFEKDLLKAYNFLKNISQTERDS
jgi:hypothetical protein